MNRKLLAIVAVAAVLALLAGAAVGRNLLSPSSTPPPAPRADVVRFKDPVAKVSIAYPASWRRLPERPGDPDLALLVAEDDSTSLLMRVSDSVLDPITKEDLPIVRKYTDDLVSVDPRAKQLVEPLAVQVGGLPGWRYRYTFGSGTEAGAHDHYFLFKDRRLIQLVFQAVPASKLPAAAPGFDKIAATFRGNDA